MFKKNDKSLLRVRGLFHLIYVIELTCSIVAGVFFLLASIGLGSNRSTITGPFAGTSLGLALIFGVAVPIALWIGWQFINLLFTYMIDVKLIRNKMYKVYDIKLLELA